MLINAANITGSGARSVVSSLIPALFHQAPGFRFSLVLPDTEEFRALELPGNPDSHFVNLKMGLSNDINRVKQIFWSIPRLGSRLRPDVCLSLGDLGPIGLPCPSVVFLHTPHLVYSHTEMNGKSWSLPKRVFLFQYLKYSTRYTNRVIVQTDVMASRFARRYGFPMERINIIAQPIPKEVNQGLYEQDRFPTIANCAKPIRLLFLSAYYPHKNHEILPGVVTEIRRRNMTHRIHIFLTLERSEIYQNNLEDFLENCSDVITNLGRLPRASVASSLRASSALFLPTLAESYGLIYLEALACGIPILTSDRDFAHWICRNLALYFEPTQPSSIVDAIESLTGFFASGNPNFLEAVKNHLAAFPKGWDEVADQFIDVLCNSKNST